MTLFIIPIINQWSSDPDHSAGWKSNTIFPAFASTPEPLIISLYSKLFALYTVINRDIRFRWSF